MKRLPAILIFTVATFGIWIAAPPAAHTLEVNFGSLDAQQPNMIHMNTGMEYAFVAGVGYSRIFRVFDRPLVLTGDVRVPYARFDFSDYRLKTGIMMPIVGNRD